MGVPKFYRWISERYPCLSEVVKEFQLPEFDNLYLDMNGIVHVCSHPDDDNPHFRITEEKIFTDICHYIDFLFRMIKPRKTFFMAVDGVAPRAKMNQQRGRRFRSAREAEELIEKAVKAGETLPTEKRFDSNCITPGTPFMVRLQEHLKFFVVDKTTRDPLWQDVKVYLSGHETPGEGEHKVMDYIRWSKSQPGHDGNTRHCLYGLDADLIMLGLASHEPHFSLLREEVRFGGSRDRNKRPVTPEETTFHLLHLSLMRDYLGYEFAPLKGKLSFPWDLECLIDDWIMMGFLVGNDFIPHLPNFHIQHDALPLLWESYMKVLPSFDGYINEGGYLNLPRLQKYFDELAKFDKKEFENAFSDLSYLESKIGGKSINESAGKTAENLSRRMKKPKPFKFSDDEGSEEDEEEFEEEEEEFDDTTQDEFFLHKKDYYMSKLKYNSVGPEVMQDLAEGYVRGIQWILLYYFEGVPSWSWYYPHHYSPYVSDVRGFKTMKFDFDLSTPFLPFEQLMAVLPAASRELLPPAMQPLMTEPTSPVIDFYPVDFQADLNGKQQSWEAVVLIPFIDEERLLAAMKTRESGMTREEHGRNTHGPHLLYTYTAADMGFYPSTLPGKFPDIHSSRTMLTKIDMATFRIESSLLKKGLGDTVDLSVYFPGFPTLCHLEHTHAMKKVGVKVFQQNSRNSSMTLHVSSKPDVRLEELADEILGKTIFVGWPHIHEARVVGLANESFKIELQVEAGKNSAAVSFNRHKLSEMESSVVIREAGSIKDRHMERFAIDVGNTEIVIYASPMTGRTYTYGNQGSITLDKQFASQPVHYAHQMTIKELRVKESGHTTFRTLEEVFPEDSTIFMLGTPHYGTQGKVLEVLQESSRIRIALEVLGEPDLQELGRLHMHDRYFNAYEGGKMIGVDKHILARMTGFVFVEKSGDKGGKSNIGLSLKFTKREEEIPGYTRKEEHGWTYSKLCMETVGQFINKFPSLWQRVSSAKSATDVFTEDELFPKGCPFTLADVLKYIEELPSSKAPKMKFGSEILDNEQVARIENMTSNIKKKPVVVKMKIKPRLLFRPLTAMGNTVPDPQTDFLLYDRIIVVKPGYSVPFGKRGTIIGIPMEEDKVLKPNSIYDVVFDDAFPGGIKLRCSPNKGYRVPGSAMLNITYGEFRKNRAPSERPTAGVWNRGRKDNKQGMPSGLNSNGNNTDNKRFDPRVEPRKPVPVSGNQQVAWDSKRQPLFGQIFARNDNTSPNQGHQGHVQPKFVTPKVQAPQPLLTSKANMKTDGGADFFNNVWKNLQKLKPTDLPNPPAPGLSHNQTSATDGKSPVNRVPSQNTEDSKPVSILSRNQATTAASPQQPTPPMVPLVQSLFANPAVQHSKPGQNTLADNADFMAMFNSLKLQTEELSRQNSSAASGMSVVDLEGSSSSTTGLKDTKPGVMLASDLEDAKIEAEAKDADNALKQMLKIGMATKSDSVSPSLSPRLSSTSAPSTLPSNASASASYGRQVSLQELFAEANRQLKTQQPQQKEDPTKTPNVKGIDNNDPVNDLEAYCTANGLAPPSYDFKHSHNQIIGNVLVHGRGRYEGSACPIKVNAAKSAASIALLCLNNKTANPPNVFAPFYPGHPMFSHNSAFSPIGLPGHHNQPPRIQAQPDQFRPPPMLTPRHFTSQPPPPPHRPMAHQPLPHPLANLNLPRQPPPPHNLLPNQAPPAMFQELHRQLQIIANDFHLQSQQQQQQQFNAANQAAHHMAGGNRHPQTFQLSPNQNVGQNRGGSSPGHSGAGIAPATNPATPSTSTSVSQPFIPLQVSRKQTVTKSKKDEKPGDSSEESTKKQNAHELKTAASSVSKNGEIFHETTKDSSTGISSTHPSGANGLQAKGAPTTTPIAAVAPPPPPSGTGVGKKEKAAMPKKKSRLAANFGKKSSTDSPTPATTPSGVSQTK